ncbi:MAG: hypothetical protein GTO19_08370 [Hydrogenophaga sp.]|nr:hypothetical protein [Hydrogenophaga sp.]NIT50326.1 hypothetical protein [Hydrogenophaga sp.]
MVNAADASSLRQASHGGPWHGARASGFRVTLALALALAATLMAARLLLYLALQLPAPVGDGVLFASVAQYHCGTGRFETPIFPLDPTGAYRYIWHGIGWPWLLSLLNPTCSIEGSFVAWSLVMTGTAALAWWALARTHGRLVCAAFALVVFALQAKLMFRPEVLAIALVVAAEALRARERLWSWAWLLSLLAWVQPTVFLIAAAHAALTLDRAGWRTLWRGAIPGLGMALALHGAIAALYPFPLADLLRGLSLQGQSFAARDDGSLFIYYLRSDFFPALGVAMLAAFALAAWRRPALLLLLPLIVYFGLRVPPAFYNLVPLFVVLLMGLLRSEGAPARNSAHRHALTVLALTAVLGALGLAQSVARDGLGAWRQHASPGEALASLQAEQAQTQRVCGVPPWFTLLLPADAFEPSHRPLLRTCPAHGGVDLVTATALANHTHATGCQHHAVNALPPWLERTAGRLFRSSTGYGMAACPAG